jgi:hypothetical protein
LAALRVIVALLLFLDTLVGGIAGAEIVHSWTTLRTQGCASTDPLNSGPCTDAHNDLWLFGVLFALSIALATAGSWFFWRTSTRPARPPWATSVVPIIVAMLLIAWFLVGVRVEF